LPVAFRLETRKMALETERGVPSEGLFTLEDVP